MLFKHKANIIILVLAGFAAIFCLQCNAQAALLLEEPYGFFGVINPAGHNAIYFSRICAETPVKLRRCEPGELGSVIARYQGIDDYDWIAVPLIPYLYSVENASDVPTHVNREQVKLMRERCRDTHLQSLGTKMLDGNLVHGGWTQLLGAAYERRIYAFRFNTTPEQDDQLIAEMNDHANRSHFNLFYNNCADLARKVLNIYFPHAFGRAVFPDAGVTSPKQVTGKLVRYAHKHPEEELAAFEIPQVPGYRRQSHSNKSIAESLTTTGYAVPIVILNPYLAAGIFVDYLVRGRFHLQLKNTRVLGPDDLSALTTPAGTQENAAIAGEQAPSVAAGSPVEMPAYPTAKSGLQETKIPNE